MDAAYKSWTELKCCACTIGVDQYRCMHLCLLMHACTCIMWVHVHGAGCAYRSIIACLCVNNLRSRTYMREQFLTTHDKGMCYETGLVMMSITTQFWSCHVWHLVTRSIEHPYISQSFLAYANGINTIHSIIWLERLVFGAQNQNWVQVSAQHYFACMLMWWRDWVWDLSSQLVTNIGSNGKNGAMKLNYMYAYMHTYT